MNAISDELLLTTAQIAATLIGLLLIGVLFFAETGLRQVTSLGSEMAAYLRAGARFVLLLYSLVLAQSLGLIALEPVWNAWLFGLLGLAILLSLVEFTLRARDLRRRLPRMHGISLWLPWPPALVMLGLPWLLDGLVPGRESVTVSLFIGVGLAFLGTASLVLLTFELSAVEQEAREGGDP